MKKMSTKKLTTLSVLTAFSIVLMLIIRFPIFPAAPYLEFEPMDIPILIAGLAYGPVAGLTVTLVSSVLQGLTVSSAVGGWFGVLMHFIASGTFVTVASLIYRKNHSMKGAIVGLAVGTIAMAAIMVPANLVLTPAFYGTPVEVIKPLLLPVIIPFNLIKAGINGVVTFFIYKPLRKYVIKPNGTKNHGTIVK